MNPSISWIDRSEFETLLRQLHTPAARRARREATPTPPSTPRVVAPAPPKASPSAHPVTTVQAPPSTPPAVSPAPKPAPKPKNRFVAPEGSIEVKANALLAWINREFACHAAFVADEHGLPVVESGTQIEFLAATATLMSTVRDTLVIFPDALAHVTVTIGPGQFLSFLLAESSWGPLGVGIVSQQSPPMDALISLADAVNAAFETDRSPQ